MVGRVLQKFGLPFQALSLPSAIGAWDLLGISKGLNDLKVGRALRPNSTQVGRNRARTVQLFGQPFSVETC